MNFQELLAKMQELDQPVIERQVIEEPNEGNEFSGALAAAKMSGKDEFEVDGKKYKVKEDGSVEECGMMPTMNSMSPMDNKQEDNVTMNVSMNGTGAGGIADLMAILRNIEEKGDSEDPMIAIGGDDVSKAQGDLDGDGDHDMDDHDMEKDDLIGQEDEMDEFANEPDEMYKSIGGVTQTGGDLHSKGMEAPKVNGGGNPLLKVKVEGILEQLTSLYKEVKSR